MGTKVPYTCPRCTYYTMLKPNMRTHFKRKKVCPDVNDIELTNFVKQKVLEGRVYHKPKIEKITNVTNNITNNHNQTNNILNYNQMEPDEKIDMLFKKLNRDVPNLTDNTFFNRKRKSLVTHKDRKDWDDEADGCRHMDDLFYEIQLFLKSFFDDEDNTNNIYNCFIKSNLFHIYENEEWEQRTIPKGMRQFIKHLKLLIFDAYEVCLIRQMTKWKLSADAKKALKDYYAFIYSFDNLPTFRERRNNDNLLLYNKTDYEYNNDDYSSFEIIDKLSDLWMEMENEMKEYKINKNTQQLKQIITHHSDKSMKELEKVCNKSKALTNDDIF